MEFSAHVIFLTSFFAMVMSSLTSANTVGWTKYPLSPWRLPPATNLAPCFFPESIKLRILDNCSSSTCTFSMKVNYLQNIFTFPCINWAWQNCYTETINNLYLQLLWKTIAALHNFFSWPSQRGQSCCHTFSIQIQSERYKNIVAIMNKNICIKTWQYKLHMKFKV